MQKGACLGILVLNQGGGHLCVCVCACVRVCIHACVCMLRMEEGGGWGRSALAVSLTQTCDNAVPCDATVRRNTRGLALSGTNR
jgi:hypothetical protein